ncbi:MAG: hypothetical protein IJY20_07585 [Clostridia bacterium]|nr:hypothetical protein [Clostridia bacterium]
MFQAELQKRNLPDLFLCPDGTRVSDRAAWETQRAYWREVLLENEYGQLPPVVEPAVTVTVNPVTFAGKAVWETVRFTFSYGQKSHTVPTQLIYPRGAKGAPFFVMLNFRPDIPDRYLPVEEILDNGFGILTFCYQDVTSDDGDFSNGLAGVFAEGERRENSFGKITLWAYMAMRCMDYLETREEADIHRVAVAGHSRLGKTALLTAALDERFAASFSNNSGCSGAAISRGTCPDGETTKVIFERFPYWFCPRYERYVDDPTTLPFDQHALLALIAPRVVGVGAADEDHWADNDAQLLSCAAASPVWELYGKPGLIAPDRMPAIGDEHTDGALGFHMRAGSHYFSRTDWLVYMRTMNKHIVK